VFKWRMLEMGKSEQDRRDDFLFSVALCLVVGVVLLIVAAIITSGRFSGSSAVSARDRIELISEQSANIVTAVLVLAAVAALWFLTTQRGARARPLVIVTLILAAGIALLAIYSVGNLLTIHIPGPGSADTVAIGLSNGESFTDRLGSVLPAAGTAFIALVAMVGANRLGNSINGSRGISGDQPD
jgi:cytochrome bd-type quinol oxidase subunit 2